MSVHCLTLRANPERPSIVEIVINRLVEPRTIESAAEEVLAGGRNNWRLPPLWDGKAASRIIEVLRDLG